MSFLIQHYLDYHALHNPAREAVCCLEENLTYAQLHIKANQLAHRLIDLGVKPNDRIGIYMNKCLDMSIAIYGVLKAGGVYVPIDPNAPVVRVASIIDDCDISFVVSHNSKIKRLPKIEQATKKPFSVIGPDTKNLTKPAGLANFHVQSWQWVFDNEKTFTPIVDVIESDLAYIIYTSGSTGKPKGIMHTHHSCLSYVHWAVNTVDVKAADRLGNHCPLHFDISIFDWFAAAVVGSCVIIIPDEYTKLPASYSQLIAQSRMTVLFTVPFALIQLSLYGELEKHDLSQLRWITFAGEPMAVKHLYNIMQMLPDVTFDNMFGPAETNVCAHYKLTVLDPKASTIPIGHMCKVAQSLIVDEQEQPVNIGETGELLVRTPTMMQGYWARPDLNKKAFYVLPNEKCVKADMPKTYYRTGDLVKVDATGLMWFVGRKDRQVKVRGYRVELDEVEAALVSHHCVEEAAVYILTTEDKTVTLHAAYTCKPNTNGSDIEIAKFLKVNLPNYALPTTLSRVQAFPRTSSDKIDRNELIKEASYVSKPQ